MSEHVVTFGGSGGLVGVVSRPAALRAGAPWVLLWNVGVNHRVGICRLNVQLARRLAELGIPSLRFDLSGLGDSAARADYRSGKERAVADAQDAMAFLVEREAATRFAAAGLCTGAHYAYSLAVADERVDSFVCMDGMAYPTPRFRIERVRAFLSSWTRIAAYVRARRWMSWFAAAENEGDETTGSDVFGWPSPPKQQALEGMKQLIQRGTRSLWVYSGETVDTYNYAEQFRDMFRSIDLPDTVASDYFCTADHLFSDQASRERLLDRVCGWMDEQYPSGQADAQTG